MENSLTYKSFYKIYITDPKCPCGWREYNDNCYLVTDDTYTYEEAAKHCEDKSAKLTSITTPQETEYIQR